MKRNKINHRVDEPDNPYAFQITFRTSGRLSAQWSSLRGLCAKYGHNERTPELFERVMLPAMRAYVAQRGYVDRAIVERLARRISG